MTETNIDIPIELPAGFTAERINADTVEIIVRCPDNYPGRCTVNERSRSLDNDHQSYPRKGKTYSGRNWRKNLYEDAVLRLKTIYRL